MNRSAFTLVELMIATAITCLIAAGTFMFFSGSGRISRAGYREKSKKELHVLRSGDRCGRGFLYCLRSGFAAGSQSGYEIRGGCRWKSSGQENHLCKLRESR